MKKYNSTPAFDMSHLMKELRETQSEYGTGLKDFKLVSELGRGSYGIAYKVEALKQGNAVFVLKRIPIKHLRPKQQREALREVEILRKLSHPHIIRYYTSFIEEDALFILMEYAAEGDLYELIRKQRSKGKYFSEREIWKFAYQMALGLDYLHYHNIIHRDIKCMNIFLTKSKVIKIGDLGVSKIAKRAIRLQGTRVGTPLYLSPELVKQQPYDFKIDIWALGCVIYYLACLEPPFLGGSFAALSESIVNKQPKSMPNNFTGTLQRFVERLIVKRPADRPTTKEILKLFPVFVKKEYVLEAGTQREEASEAGTAAITSEGANQKQCPSSESQDPKVLLPAGSTDHSSQSRSVVAVPTSSAFLPATVFSSPPPTDNDIPHVRLKQDPTITNPPSAEPVVVYTAPTRPSTVNTLPAQCWTNFDTGSKPASQGQSPAQSLVYHSNVRTSGRTIIMCQDWGKRAVTAAHKARPTLALLKNLRAPTCENGNFRPNSAGCDLQLEGRVTTATSSAAADFKVVPESAVVSRPQTALQLGALPTAVLPRIHILQLKPHYFSNFNNRGEVKKFDMDSSKYKTLTSTICVENRLTGREIDGKNGVAKAVNRRLTITDL